MAERSEGDWLDELPDSFFDEVAEPMWKALEKAFLTGYAKGFRDGLNNIQPNA